MNEMLRPLPQPGLMPDAQLEAAVAAANDFLVDQNRELRRDKRALRTVALVASVLAAVCGMGWASELRKGVPPAKLLAFDPIVGGLRLIGDLREFNEALPGQYGKLADDWFLKEFTASHEKYNRADRKQAFLAAACPMAEEEAKRFKAWFDRDPEAPQQLFEEGGQWPGGWREIGTVGEPDVVGRGDGWLRYEVHFRAFDYLPGRTDPVQHDGRLRFNARKDRNAVTLCNPRGFVISDIFRDLPRSATP